MSTRARNQKNATSTNQTEHRSAPSSPSTRAAAAKLRRALVFATCLLALLAVTAAGVALSHAKYSTTMQLPGVGVKIDNTPGAFDLYYGTPTSAATPTGRVATTGFYADPGLTLGLKISTAADGTEYIEPIEADATDATTRVTTLADIRPILNANNRPTLEYSIWMLQTYTINTATDLAVYPTIRRMGAATLKDDTQIAAFTGTLIDVQATPTTASATSTAVATGQNGEGGEGVEGVADAEGAATGAADAEGAATGAAAVTIAAGTDAFAADVFAASGAATGADDAEGAATGADDASGAVAATDTFTATVAGSGLSASSPSPSQTLGVCNLAVRLSGTQTATTARYTVREASGAFASGELAVAGVTVSASDASAAGQNSLLAVESGANVVVAPARDASNYPVNPAFSDVSAQGVAGAAIYAAAGAGLSVEGATIGADADLALAGNKITSGGAGAADQANAAAVYIAAGVHGVNTAATTTDAATAATDATTTTAATAMDAATAATDATAMDAATAATATDAATAATSPESVRSEQTDVREATTYREEPAREARVLNDFTVELTTSTTPVTFTNCLIEGNVSALGAGAVYSESSITMTDCTVSQNSTTAASAPGAVQVAGGIAPTFSNCNFTSNAGTAGGALATAAATAGSGAAAAAPDVSITGGQFMYNTSTGSAGAIYLAAGTLAAQNTAFDQNSAATSGGAIEAAAAAGAITLSGCTLAKNTATGSGGAINAQNAPATGTTDTAVALQNTTFTGNTAQNGGAIAATNKVSVEGGAFASNAATANGGGVQSAGEVEVQDADFSENTAASGAGVYASGAVTVTGGTFSGNAATGNGGGVYAGGAFSAGGGVAFAGNSAASGAGAYAVGAATATGAAFSKNIATANGGGIYSGAAFVATDGATFTENTAANGGGVWVAKGSANATGCEFVNNVAKTDGGAIGMASAVSSKLGDNTFSNCTLTGNSASQYGAAIFGNTGSSIKAVSCTINLSTAKKGAAIYTETGPVTTELCLIEDNVATERGAGIVTRGPLVVSESILADNQAPAAVAIDVFVGSTISITQSTISGNVASGETWGSTGAAILRANSTVIDSCDISNNDGDGEMGVGGIIVTGGTLDMRNTRMYYNGGCIAAAVYLDQNCNATFTDCTFDRNLGSRLTGSTGGAIGTGWYTGATITTTRCIFKRNVASWGGAIGIYYLGSLTATQCEFYNNSANYGAAIWSQAEGLVKLDDCRIYDNAATIGGVGFGAVYMSRSNVQSLDYTNSYIYQNTAYGIKFQYKVTANGNPAQTLIPSPLDETNPRLPWKYIMLNGTEGYWGDMVFQGVRYTNSATSLPDTLTSLNLTGAQNYGATKKNVGAKGAVIPADASAGLVDGDDGTTTYAPERVTFGYNPNAPAIPAATPLDESITVSATPDLAANTLNALYATDVNTTGTATDADNATDSSSAGRSATDAAATDAGNAVDATAGADAKAATADAAGDAAASDTGDAAATEAANAKAATGVADIADAATNTSSAGRSATDPATTD